MYTIAYNDALVDTYAVELEKDASGYSDHDQHTITLRTKGHSEGAVRRTLVHELLHSGLSITGAWYRGQFDSKEAEEALLQSVSAPLLAILRENPHIVEYLTREESSWPEVK